MALGFTWAFIALAALGVAVAWMHPLGSRRDVIGFRLFGVGVIGASILGVLFDAVLD